MYSYKIKQRAIWILKKNESIKKVNGTKVKLLT